ncbi:MAG: copper resistance protein CopB [Micavibrio sp.]|nr:copper resistance protein CopB [Micavibrio sp.]|tara:strand:- start:216 stop:1052 length:837 start_codon:yes stop_codon:yes gene_type:complete
MKTMNYLLLILAVFSLPLSAYAQDRNFPDDYHDITTDPQVGEPIKKVVDDEQEGAQTNFGTQQVHDDQIFYQVIGDRLEQRFQQGDNALLYDMQGWVGNDYNKLWIKAEGEYNTSTDEHEETSFETLYSRNAVSFWDIQAGIRHDFLSGADDRDFAAFGIQGLAPYWFEVEATSYISDEGDVSGILEAEYDLLLSQKLILQPRFETEVAVQDVEDYNIGSGITGFETGLRLRYEFSRKFAPYIGVSWEQNLGETKDMLEADGEQTNNTALVTGLKFWF